MLVDDAEIFVTAGGCIAMYLALEAILDDGDEVIMQAPYFTPYLQQIELARGIPVELPTYEEEGFPYLPFRSGRLSAQFTTARVSSRPLLKNTENAHIMPRAGLTAYLVCLCWNRLWAHFICLRTSNAQG